MPSTGQIPLLSVLQPPHEDTHNTHHHPARDQYRVVVLGAARVGKTAIVHQFLYDEFPVDYVPTVEESRSKKARRIHDQIVELHSAKAPVVVVGNKCELPASMRRVRREVAETIISIDWENGFVESSAKDNVNVFAIFKELLVQAKIPV
ncbi:hypothetical protein MTO96_035628 [Rhipicephalus appendiculatus]